MKFKDVEFNIEEIDQSLRDAGIELKDKSAELDEQSSDLNEQPSDGITLTLPCVREIDSPLGKWEAVYIGSMNCVQECIVSAPKEGWMIIESYGNDMCSKIATERLREAGE